MRSRLPAILLALVAIGCGSYHSAHRVAPAEVIVLSDNQGKPGLSHHVILRSLLTLADLEKQAGPPRACLKFGFTWFMYQTPSEEDLWLCFDEGNSRLLYAAKYALHGGSIVRTRIVFAATGLGEGPYELADFHLTNKTTANQITVDVGPPNMISGSGVIWLVYRLSHEQELRLFFLGNGNGPLDADVLRDMRQEKRTETHISIGAERNGM